MISDFLRAFIILRYPAPPVLDNSPAFIIRDIQKFIIVVLPHHLLQVRALPVSNTDFPKELSSSPQSGSNSAANMCEHILFFCPPVEVPMILSPSILKFLHSNFFSERLSMRGQQIYWYLIERFTISEGRQHLEQFFIFPLNEVEIKITRKAPGK